MNITEILKEKKDEIDRAIEKLIPKEYDIKKLKETFGEPRYEFDPEVATKSFSKLVWDLLDRGGKRWRPVLFILILEAFGRDYKKYLNIAAALEIVHNGTLMVDDIEDDSDLRRGEPCTHKKFGIDLAINTGNTMYFLPMVSIRKMDIDDKTKNKLYETYIQEMTNISLGQSIDIAWHRGIGKVTEKRYMQMCAFKTGTLARMSAKFAAVLTGLDDKKVDEIGMCAEAIGVAFQIQDDILNITGSRGWGKTHGEDITEGKRSLMVVHTLEIANNKDRKRLVEILDMHTKKRKLIDEAIGIMDKYNSLDYAKNTAKEILTVAWENVEDIFPNNRAKEKIKAFVTFMVDREI